MTLSLDEYNAEKSRQRQQEEKYVNFMQWLRENGAIFDKVSEDKHLILWFVFVIQVEFPAIYGEGLQGLRLKEDLAPNEPLLYIPNKCIITPEHAKASPIAHLFDCHDALFVTNYDRESTIIMVYIIYERLKGAESFYHPYFEMVDYT